MYPIDHTFDVGLANELARLESYNKHLYRPNTYLHKWWARRCGTTFRLILKHLVTDPERVDYYAAGGLEGKVVLDPMIGGGTTLHEALRLGANVVGLDVDPIPVLQADVTLRDTALERLEAGFERLYARLQEGVGAYFESDCPRCLEAVPLSFVLHGSLRRCNCGPAVMVDSLLVRRESDGAEMRLCPSCGNLTGPGACCKGPATSDFVLIEKAQQTCPTCAEPYRELTDLPLYQRYVPLISHGDCPRHGPFWKRVDERDRYRLEDADRRRPALGGPDRWQIAPGPKNDYLLAHGVSNYLDLFSSRQLLWLQEARQALRPLDNEVGLLLTLLVSTSLDFNSILCGYKGTTRRRPGAVRHTFAHHGYWLPYTALENNPLSPVASSGTLKRLFSDRVRRARRWAKAPRERVLREDGHRFRVIPGEQDAGWPVARVVDLGKGAKRYLVRQASGVDLPLGDESVDFVVTDPPYYDSVQYGELSAYFRVWLEYLLDGRTEAQPLAWRYDYRAAAVQRAGRDRPGYDPDRHEEILSAIFSECNRVLRAGGRMVLTYHHWQAEAWSGLTVALSRARFRLVNAYVVHSESPMSVHIVNFRSLSDDAILVLDPRPSEVDWVWTKPGVIRQESSAAFCEDCAAAVGWMLQADLADDAIRQTWQRLLPRN